MENLNPVDPAEVAVLGQKLEDLKHIVIKIDAAIEKISEVNSSVSKMLAVHEQRITKQEEIDTVLFAKIDKLRDKMDRDHDIVSATIIIIGTKNVCGLQYRSTGSSTDNYQPTSNQNPGVTNVLLSICCNSAILAGDQR